jgi:hypothetical protein
MGLSEGAQAEALRTSSDWTFFFVFVFVFFCWLWSLRDDDGLLEYLRVMLTCWL